MSTAVFLPPVRLARAETSRALRVPVYWFVALGGIAFMALGIAGMVMQAAPALNAGRADAADVSLTLSTSSVALALFTNVVGILIATRDVHSRFLNRILGFSGSPVAVAEAKAVAGAVVGAIVGLVGTLATLGISAVALRVAGHSYALPDRLGLFLGQHVLLLALSTVLGVAVGLLLRSSVVAILVSVIYQLLVETVVTTIWPKTTRWVLGGLESAIGGDTVTGGLFGFWPGLGLYVAWILVFFAGALVVSHARRAK
ncbi:MAG: hypothetical protein LBR33_06230 [Propionibacteriaceae bacterium]|jgi:hypothetical protein|nr:hypothetical protein [Propionibacteriaceae bacterium]